MRQAPRRVSSLSKIYSPSESVSSKQGKRTALERGKKKTRYSSLSKTLSVQEKTPIFNSFSRPRTTAFCFKTHSPLISITQSLKEVMRRFVSWRESTPSKLRMIGSRNSFILPPLPIVGLSSSKSLSISKNKPVKTKYDWLS